MAGIWRRQPKNESGENKCPYCGQINPEGAISCKLCYYDLTKSARQQGEVTEGIEAKGIFDELMSEDDDSWQDSPALDVQLSMDDVSIDVEQYEVVTLGEGEVENFDFIEAKVEPERVETVVHQNEAGVHELKLSDAPEKFSKFEVGNHDYMSEVAEPVHIRRGNLVMDEEIHEDYDFTESNDPLELPELPELDSLDDSQLVDSPPPLPDSEPVISKESDLIKSIWPWNLEEPWDSRDVYKDVVNALELTKAGQLNEAKIVIDRLGPHLSDDLSMLYHIGIVLKEIGREKEMRIMIESASKFKPENEHVKTAITHLLEN